MPVNSPFFTCRFEMWSMFFVAFRSIPYVLFAVPSYCSIIPFSVPSSSDYSFKHAVLRRIHEKLIEIKKVDEWGTAAGAGARL